MKDSWPYLIRVKVLYQWSLTFCFKKPNFSLKKNQNKKNKKNPNKQNKIKENSLWTLISIKRKYIWPMTLYKTDGMQAFFIVNSGDIHTGAIEVFPRKESFENGIVRLSWFCHKTTVNEMISWYWFNKPRSFSR